jgi:hypothetical protein
VRFCQLFTRNGRLEAWAVQLDQAQLFTFGACRNVRARLRVYDSLLKAHGV